MTTISDVLAPEDQVFVVPRRRVWPRVLAAFFVGLLLSLVVAGGALLAWDAAYEGRVLSGVDVGGVDLSGLDRAGASAALAAAFDGYAEGRVVLRTSAGNLNVPYAAFSRQPDVEAMVEAALRTGRTGTALERAVGEVRLAMSGTSLETRVRLDESALRTEIERAVARHDRRPVDSTITLDANGLHRTLARRGRSFDGAAAATVAIESLRRTDAPPEVVVDVAVTAIQPDHGDDEALAVEAAAKRMITDVVVTYGGKEWKIKAKTVRSWLGLKVATDGSVWPSADETAIVGSLKKIGKAVRRDPVSARYLKSRGGRIVGVVAAASGRRLDTARTAAAIAHVLVERSRGAAVTPVKAKVAKVEPKLTTAEALKKGPLMERLGSWATYFPIGERNYWGANIWRPAEIIDGSVLMPGQRFEWWSAIGPVSSAYGYGPGGFIAGDHTEPTGALGGGMCSSSTTLFNAALRAGLQMGSRINHRYYINRYPLGLDATVSKARGGSQTLSFTNDMDDPIVIRTFRYRAGGRGWVRYEIWGIPDGRRVSLSRPAVSNVRRATTRTVYVSTLRRGVREQVEYPANGMDVSVTRVVRASGGRILHRDTYRTHYALWNGIIHVGQ